MSVWETALQLRAWEAGRALPRVGRQRVLLRDEAWICCPLAMAGEDPSLHAVLLGPRRGAGQLLAAPDPRSPRHRLELFSRLRRVLDEHFAACLARQDGFPQLLLPSQSAVDVLLGLADYLPYLPDPKEGGKQLAGWVEDARALGNLLQLYRSRYDLVGQQLLLTASGMLDSHWAFGQELRGHLGAQLVWVDPPSDESVLLAAARAELEPMGAKTDAALDAEQLAPALEAWAKVERSASRSLGSFRRQEIEDLLAGVLRPVQAAVGQAADQVEGLALAPLAGLEVLAERERAAFEQHMAHLADGGRFARQDSPTRAVYALAEREDAAEQWQAAVLWDDPLGRAQARLEGRVLHGTVRQLDPGTLHVVSAQRWLRVRRGDELQLMDGSGLRAVVDGLERCGAETQLTLRVGAGTLPADGATTDWADAPPDWRRLYAERGKIARNLAELPPTHQQPDSPDGSTPMAPPLDGPDPLAAIEALR